MLKKPTHWVGYRVEDTDSNIAEHYYTSEERKISDEAL
jgi:hypothetical protein